VAASLTRRFGDLDVAEEAAAEAFAAAVGRGRPAGTDWSRVVALYDQLVRDSLPAMAPHSSCR
jgi:predicted RNA polymerase sigma factor